jgi:hypothetical protein
MKLNQQALNNLNRLVGRWEAEDRDSAAVFEIAVAEGKPVVTGFDSMDGERFKISKVEWDGKSLSFAAYVTSTRYRSKHRFTLVRPGLIDHELTLIERWKKVRRPAP